MEEYKFEKFLKEGKADIPLDGLKDKLSFENGGHVKSKVKLKNGKYEGERWTYVLEVEGKQYDTKTGYRNPEFAAFSVDVFVKDGIVTKIINAETGLAT